jgi:hypothetical protein
MPFDTDVETDPGIGDTELAEAVEWLSRRGFLRRRPSPLEALLDD